MIGWEWLILAWLGGCFSGMGFVAWLASVGEAERAKDAAVKLEPYRPPFVGVLRKAKQSDFVITEIDQQP